MRKAAQVRHNKEMDLWKSGITFLRKAVKHLNGLGTTGMSQLVA